MRRVLYDHIHIEIFSFLEFLRAVQKGETQMTPNLDCALDVP
jgi:hypothetical protein